MVFRPSPFKQLADQTNLKFQNLGSYINEKLLGDIDTHWAGTKKNFKMCFYGFTNRRVDSK